MGRWNVQKHLDTWDAIVPANNFRSHLSEKDTLGKETKVLFVPPPASILVKCVLLLQLEVYRSFYHMFTFLKFVLSACSLLFCTHAEQQWAFSLVWAAPLPTLCYHQSEQDQVNSAFFCEPPSDIFSQPKQGVHAQTLGNKHALILPRRISGLQSDTPLAVFTKGGYLVPELFFSRHISTHLRPSVATIEIDTGNVCVPLGNRLQLCLATFSGSLILVLGKFPLSTSGEYLHCSLCWIPFWLSDQQPPHASLYLARMCLLAKYLNCLLLVFDLLVNLCLLQPSFAFVLNSDFV